jgi:hypothetical protein
MRDPITEDKLRYLPQWAIVAFAARCARRLEIFVPREQYFVNGSIYKANQGAICCAEVAANVGGSFDPRSVGLSIYAESRTAVVAASVLAAERAVQVADKAHKAALDRVTQAREAVHDVHPAHVEASQRASRAARDAFDAWGSTSYLQKNVIRNARCQAAEEAHAAYSRACHARDLAESQADKLAEELAAAHAMCADAYACSAAYAAFASAFDGVRTAAHAVDANKFAASAAYYYGLRRDSDFAQLIGSQAYSGAAADYAQLVQLAEIKGWTDLSSVDVALLGDIWPEAASFDESEPD